MSQTAIYLFIFRRDFLQIFEYELIVCIRFFKIGSYAAIYIFAHFTLKTFLSNFFVHVILSKTLDIINVTGKHAQITGKPMAAFC